MSLLLVFLSLLQAQPSSVPTPGQLVERIVCRQDPEQSYALYLPSHYREGKKWPVILALDPGARGKFPVEAFREAAEEYGYILIGSNNSRNGPMDASGAALHAMWEDAFERYSLDVERIYLTGFSGGARMAGRFALLSKRVRAVILCGAGFDLPEAGIEIPFSVILASGNWDSNYLEIKTLNADLLDREARVRLITFEGGHVWPSSSVCREAVQWLEIGLYRDGIQASDQALIDSLYEQELKRAEALKSSRQFFDAYLSYLDLKSDLEGLRDLSEVEKEIAALEGSNRLRASLEGVRRLEKTERRYIKDFLKEFFKEKPKKLDWWQDKLDSMTKMEKKKGEDQQYQLLVRRLREFVWRNGWERSWVASQAGEYERAAYLAEIAVLVRKDANALFFHLSRMYALSGQQDKAVDNLEKAVEKGFDDLQRIEEEPAFSSLREHPRFQKLIGQDNS
jgi:predicted esterase